MAIPEEVTPFQVPRLFHRTWAGTFACQPAAYFQPRSIDEVSVLVKAAKRHGQTLTTVGSGHLPLDLTMTLLWLVNLDAMNQVLQEHPHPLGTYTDVDVQAGIRIHELNTYLATRGLAVQNLGSISEQLVAGIIQTGTHGLSSLHGLVLQQFVLLTLVDGAGEVITCLETEQPEVFRAAACGLGQIGLVVGATLRTVPRYQIKSRQEVVEFQTLLDQWDLIWLTDEFIRCWWFPYTGKCILWRALKLDEPILLPRELWYGTWLGRLFYQALLWVSVKVAPRITPWIERFVFRQQYGSVETLGRGDVAVQELVDGLNMDCLFLQFVDEWAMPLAPGVEILQKLDGIIKDAARTGAYYVHAPIEVRCSNTTGVNRVWTSDEWDAFLASRKPVDRGPVPGNTLRPFMDPTPRLEHAQPPLNNQLTLYINATMYRPFHQDVPVGQWFQDFEDLVGSYGGKPHWAKNFLGPPAAVVLATLHATQQQYGGRHDGEMAGFGSVMDAWFGSDLTEFKQVRAHVDPAGVFLGNKDWVARNGLE